MNPKMQLPIVCISLALLGCVRGHAVPRALACTYTQSPLAREAAQLQRRGVLGGQRELLRVTAHYLLVRDNSAASLPVRVLDRPSLRVLHTLDWGNALVEDDSGRLVGLLGITFTHGTPYVTFLDLNGKGRWGIDGLGLPIDEGAAALVDRGRLVFVLYGRALSYAEAVGVELASGALRWKRLLRGPETHGSGEPSDVAIERRGMTLHIHGFESKGCYDHALDRATGRPVSSR